MVITYHRQCIMPQRSFGIALMLGHISYYAWQNTIFTYPLTVDIMVTSTSFQNLFLRQFLSSSVPQMQHLNFGLDAVISFWIGCSRRYIAVHHHIARWFSIWLSVPSSFVGYSHTPVQKKTSISKTSIAVLSPDYHLFSSLLRSTRIIYLHEHKPTSISPIRWEMGSWYRMHVTTAASAVFSRNHHNLNRYLVLFCFCGDNHRHDEASSNLALFWNCMIYCFFRHNLLDVCRDRVLSPFLYLALSSSLARLTALHLQHPGILACVVQQSAPTITHSKVASSFSKIDIHHDAPWKRVDDQSSHHTIEGVPGPFGWQHVRPIESELVLCLRPPQHPCDHTVLMLLGSTLPLVPIRVQMLAKDSSLLAALEYPKCFERVCGLGSTIQAIYL